MWDTHQNFVILPQNPTHCMPCVLVLVSASVTRIYHLKLWVILLPSNEIIPPLNWLSSPLPPPFHRAPEVLAQEVTSGTSSTTAHRLHHTCHVCCWQWLSSPEPCFSLLRGALWQASLPVGSNMWRHTSASAGPDCGAASPPPVINTMETAFP